jgi:formylmethanofuran dehydrogenase subunit C
MSGWTLRLRQPPALRLDLSGVTAAALAADAARTPVGLGNAQVELGEFFDVTARADETLVFEGDCARCDRIGWQMAQGELIVDGAAGDYAGAGLRGGAMTVRGDAGDLAACEMSGGTLEIEGRVGDFAASTLPGSMDGMRGGTLIVRGDAGARFADRMRRGTALVFGDAGDFLASRLVAGTIALAGRCGAHPGYGMRRGTLLFAGEAPQVPPTYVRAIDDADVFWRLLARDLSRFGGAFSALAARRTERFRGDLAAEGKGEWIVCR